MIINFLVGAFDNTYESAGFVVFVYPFRFIRLYFTISLCLIPSKTAIFKVSIITRKAIDVFCYIVIVLLTITAFFHMLNYSFQPNVHLDFLGAFYFIFVTTSTGLSTTLIPETDLSRIMVVLALTTFIFVIPRKISELVSLISKKSIYEHSFKRGGHQNHVILCGKFDYASLNSFLKEFFCPDHGKEVFNTSVVILGPEEPSEEISVLLADPIYSHRVQYVKGSILESRSNEKVLIKYAQACFIFSSKYTSQKSNEEDADTVMRAISVRKSRPNIELHVQVLLPEHKYYFDFLCIDS